MKKHPQFKGVVGIAQLVDDSKLIFRRPHLINHSIKLCPVEVAVVILNVLDMNIRHSLISLPFFHRLVGISLGVLHRGHLPGINLQIVRVPVAAVNELYQVLKVHLLAIDPLNRNVELSGFLLNQRRPPLSGHQQ